MYKNGVARPSRRQEGDSTYDADTDSRRAHSRQPLVRQSSKVAPQYPQNLPIGSNHTAYEERNGREGGYGAVAPPAAAKSSVTATSATSWIQQFFLHRPDAQTSQPTQKSKFGTSVYRSSWHHHNSFPPPPPPIQHLPLDQQQQGNRSSMPSSHQFSLESMLYYSDEEDSVFEIPTQGLSITEFSTAATVPTLLGPLIREVDVKMGPKNRRILLPHVSSYSELSEAVETTSLVTATNNHRRNSSDFVYQKPPSSHRRTSSAELWAAQKRGSDLPNNSDGTLLRDRSPLPLHPFHRKSTPTTAARPRSYSGGPSKPHHRRGDSASSNTSMASILSEKSIISDISRSILYKKVTNTGQVTFHSPADKVRLVMDKDLQPGHLYRLQGGEDEEERYFQYTLQSEEAVDFPLTEGGCCCECVSCAKCQHKVDQQLYPSQYVLRVDDDLYQRVISEISDSKQPCGLFFCGHHEDADKPSILIAIGIIVAFFGGLLVVTYLGQGG